MLPRFLLLLTQPTKVTVWPTLALLNETRNNLRKYEDKYKIIVRVADQPDENRGNLFLLTAERVMEYKNMPPIDMFILDEFYKISQKRDDERYEVLNNACNKMLNIHKARFYFLGPNIDKISLPTTPVAPNTPITGKFVIVYSPIRK